MAQAMTVNMSEGRRQALERRRAQALNGGAGKPVRPTDGCSAAKATVAAMPQTVLTEVRQGQRVVFTGTPAGGRAVSIARRRAMASQGKRGIAAANERAHVDPLVVQSVARKLDKDCGCGGREAEGVFVDKERTGGLILAAPPAPKLKTAAPRRAIGQPEGRQLSKMRRRMLAEKGRSAITQTERVRSPAERARHLNPDLNGRELAKEMRSERSRSGGRGQKSSAPCGRQRTGAGGAQDAPWKVGSSETGQGQTVTGTQIGRSRRVTGDEPSTCRPITGTEYLGAEIFREFCQSRINPGPIKVSQSKTAAGRTVTGTEVGRSTRVTGDEAGSCKRVTGNEYFPAGQVSVFCGDAPVSPTSKITVTRTGGGRAVSGSNVDRPARVTGNEAGMERATTGTPYISPLPPPREAASLFKKVGVSSTLRGGEITGTLVGRSSRVTGDEPSTCRQITGDEYLGGEQYEAFCPEKPRAEAPKVGVSETYKGKLVTGTQTGRATRVTGDEAGTCKSVTGTPYAGIETYRDYCAPEVARGALARGRVGRATPGLQVTGIQPGIGGKMTGDHRGACETVTGTPYVGQDQYSKSCGGLGAVPGNPDFPRSLDSASWVSTFSVSTPARDAQRARQLSGVTGTRYEQGHVTGPFGMGAGKITGTEEFRFGDAQGTVPIAPQPESIPPRSNITGEGMDTGLRITGDDWGRNERVTGTEGRSAMQRNPTRRGTGVAAMPIMGLGVKEKRAAELMPSRVTGSSGNTDKGALVTVSGGARG